MYVGMYIYCTVCTCLYVGMYIIQYIHMYTYVCTCYVKYPLCMYMLLYLQYLSQVILPFAHERTTLSRVTLYVCMCTLIYLMYLYELVSL